VPRLQLSAPAAARAAHGVFRLQLTAAHPYAQMHDILPAYLAWKWKLTDHRSHTVLFARIVDVMPLI
jgi:hypothetical protein